MRILVTNDDGITAPGLRELVNTLSEKHEVLVVAPSQEASATGHAITIRLPIWVKEMKIDDRFLGYSVMGTPADCVKLGLDVFSKGKVDLILSGINRGPNLGTDIIYSGTVSGALEGALQGVPSMAISMCNFDDPKYETGAKVAEKLVDEFPWELLPEFCAINVNVPNLPYEKIKGFRVTRQSRRRYRDYFEARRDPYGNTYYWMLGDVIEDDTSPDSDYLAVKEGYVSITPITIFLTAEDVYKELKRRMKW